MTRTLQSVSVAMAACAVAGGTAVATHSTIRGTSGPDRLEGTPRHDRMLAFGGDDTVDGRGGPDRIRAGRGEDTVFGGTGRDRIFVRDGERDDVECGGGRDRVLADQFDRLTGCERVTVRRMPPRGDERDDDHGRDDGDNSGPGR